MSQELFEGISDIYLPASRDEKAWVYPGPRPVPKELCDATSKMLEIALQNESKDFQVALNDVRFRCHRMPTMTGDLYIFRKTPAHIWTLRECGIPNLVRRYLVSDRLNAGGLIIVAGLPGAGKTTTCASVIKSRLELHGGLCITVEDPVEMPLQGPHNEGLCYQRSVLYQEDFNSAVRDAMRAYPVQSKSMFLIGEVRDAETAALALRSSIDGRLTITTMHAGSIVQAMHRMLSFASKSMGESEAKNLLASSFRVALSQKLVNRKLSLQMLLDTQPVAGVLNSKTDPMESLVNEIRNQRNILRMGKNILLRNIS